MANTIQIDGLDVEIVVGLEIHVQLATATKMFCACRQEFGAPPNSRTCPVCLGLPGVLPVMNRQAYEFAVRTALALNCEIATFTKWDRKSYYYPDLPKNYQISQYDLPLSRNGWMEIPVDAPPPQPSPAAGGGSNSDIPSPRPSPNGGGGNEAGPVGQAFQPVSTASKGCATTSPSKRIRIRRAHLEEDAGKLLHEGIGPYSQVDLNRTGTPLLEIVTEPDMSTPAEVGDFGRELRRLVRHLGVSEANMQMGQMRLEPNVNCIIRKDGQEFRTPIAEVKNLNSFKHVESAIAYEARRQVAAWQKTGVTMASGNKATMGWDPDRGATFVQREKEEAHDYRYFPDPDLPPVVMDEEWLGSIYKTVVELPARRRQRYIEKLGLDPKDADILIEERANCELFDAAVLALPAGAAPRRLAKLLLSEGNKRANERNVSLAGLPIGPGGWAELVGLLESAKISATASVTILDEMLGSASGAGCPDGPAHEDTAARGPAVLRLNDAFADVAASSSSPRPGVPASPRPASSESAEAIARRLGLIQTSDSSAIEPIIDEVIAANSDSVADVRGKKGEKALGPLIGKVLKKAGAANPAMVREMLKKKLGLP